MTNLIFFIFLEQNILILQRIYKKNEAVLFSMPAISYTWVLNFKLIEMKYN